VCAHHARVRIKDEAWYLSGLRFFIRLVLLWQKRTRRSFEVFRPEEPYLFGDIQLLELVARLRSPVPEPSVQDNRQPFLQAAE
jgi:hypothetical protein